GSLGGALAASASPGTSTRGRRRRRSCLRPSPAGAPPDDLERNGTAGLNVTNPSPVPATKPARRRDERGRFPPVEVTARERSTARRIAERAPAGTARPGRPC